MIRKCKNCGGKGHVLVNLAGVFLDATCLDCDGTGYVNVPEEFASSDEKTVEAEVKKD